MAQSSGFHWLSLGGVGEIGKNCYVIEIDGKLLVIDVGMSFPDLKMFGVDIVIPDFSWLVKHQQRIKGIILTHGHEDHIGSVPFLLQDLRQPPPIYGARFTLGLLRGKLAEFNLGDTPLTQFTPGDKLDISGIAVQTIRITHSIPDACSLTVETPAGLYLHSGDVKIDPTPIDGKFTDIAKLQAAGERGIVAMTIDTTNIERTGRSGSESSVRPKLKELVANHHGRVFITTFASNIHRIQQAIDVAAQLGRKVLIVGRTMVTNVQMAQDLGYLHVPPNLLVDPKEAEGIKPDKLLIVLTGSQGEPLAAMSRIANGDHRFIHIMEDDLFIFSARPIPGNEVAIFGVIDDLFRQGAEVIYGMDAGTHVSGHGYQDELQEYIGYANPQFVIPFHGEYRMQMRFKKIAPSWGIPESNVIMVGAGQRWHVNEGGFKLEETVKAGEVFIGGKGSSDLSRKVINERLSLAEDGMLVFSLVLNADGSRVLAGPDLVSRGFIMQSEAPDLFSEIEQAVLDAFERNKQRKPEFQLQLRNNIQNVIQQVIFKRTKVNPVVIGLLSYASADA
jgi:ribonuclease J